MVRFSPPDAQPGVDDGDVLPSVHVFAVQGHPEFTATISRKIIDVRAARGIIDETTAKDGRVRAEWRDDGVDIVGRAIWAVLRT